MLYWEELASLSGDAMTQDVNPQPPTEPQPSPAQEAKEKRLFYSTLTLSRFIRACYGPDAPQEAQRRVTAYTRKSNFEIAEIWKRVLEHLHGFKSKESTRFIVKAPKPFTVKD
jgi:hypothetical protein